MAGFLYFCGVRKFSMSHFLFSPHLIQRVLARTKDAKGNQ